MKEKGIIVENKLSDPKKAELVIDILNKLINEGLSFNQITQVLRTAESEGWKISVAKSLECYKFVPEDSNGICKNLNEKCNDTAPKIDLKKAHTCISYHIQAYQQQDIKEEIADVTEACKHCVYNLDCDFAWAGYILSAIPEAKYRFTLARGLEYQPEDIDP